MIGLQVDASAAPEANLASVPPLALSYGPVGTRGPPARRGPPFPAASRHAGPGPGAAATVTVTVLRLAR